MTETRSLLSVREIECLMWLAEGLDDRKIASRLRIKRRTVRYHLANVRKVLKARNRTHAVALALRQGLIPLHQDAP